MCVLKYGKANRISIAKFWFVSTLTRDSQCSLFYILLEVVLEYIIWSILYGIMESFDSVNSSWSWIIYGTEVEGANFRETHKKTNCRQTSSIVSAIGNVQLSSFLFRLRMISWSSPKSKTSSFDIDSTCNWICGSFSSSSSSSELSIVDQISAHAVSKFSFSIACFDVSGRRIAKQEVFIWV